MVYDKMILFLYQSRYSDPFSIVEALPEIDVMVENMLYITLTGYLYTKFAKSVVQLGTVEKVNGVIDPEQLAILRKVGTVYFMNAESRYLDMQTRMLQLPFQNGNYQLSLSLAKEQLIDNDTIIKFNQSTNQFEIMGNEFQPFKWLKDIYKYMTVTTKSISTYIEAGFNAIRSEVNIDESWNNGIQVLAGGLFVDTSNFIDLEQYRSLVESFYQYKNIIDSYVNQLRTAVQEVIATVSDESIDEKIDEALTAYKPEILEMIEDYDSFSTRLDALEEAVYRDLNDRINSAKQEIINYVASFNNAWQEFPADLDDPYYEYQSS
jgi:hypothetical protein